MPVDGRDAPASGAPLASPVGDGPNEASSDSSSRRRTAASSVTGGWREEEGRPGAAVELAAGDAKALEDADAEAEAGVGAEGAELETGGW